MTSRRILKAASAIREVVSMAILTELRDPRVQNVTVTFVEVSGDMRQAKIHVSVMGDEKAQQLCLHGLRSSCGFLQQRVSDRIDTRYTPRLKFVLDDGVKKSAEVHRILGELLPESNARSLPSHENDSFEIDSPDSDGLWGTDVGEGEVDDRYFDSEAGFADPIDGEVRFEEPPHDHSQET